MIEENKKINEENTKKFKIISNKLEYQEKENLKMKDDRRIKEEENIQKLEAISSELEHQREENVMLKEENNTRNEEVNSQLRKIIEDDEIKRRKIPIKFMVKKPTLISAIPS